MSKRHIMARSCTNGIMIEVIGRTSTSSGGITMMDKPERLMLKKRANYRTGCLIGLACLFFPVLGLGIAYFTGEKLDDLTLPGAILGSIAIIVTVVVWTAVSITVLWERRSIRRLLSGDLWAQWQYQPDE